MVSDIKEWRTGLATQKCCQGASICKATRHYHARVRHPQYAGFILIMTGFLFQWPTLVTLAMFQSWCTCTCISRGMRV